MQQTDNAETEEEEEEEEENGNFTRRRNWRFLN